MPNLLITRVNSPAALQATNQRLATIVSLLLIVACAYLLVQVIWMVVLPAQESSLAISNQTQSIVSVQDRQENFRKLAAANLFGESDKTVVQIARKAPETKLNLTLRGVLAATPAELASAIIAQGKAGNEDIYSIGDKMSGGVVIKEIHPTYVVLERNGQLETLRLPKESGPDILQSNNTMQKIQSPGGALKQIRADILKNPTSFGQYALPILVKENGRQVGYRLKPQSKGELLSELGIESSDVIIEINGIKLDEQKNALKALSHLSTAKNLDIVVKRNGAEVPLNISLQ